MAGYVLDTCVVIDLHVAEILHIACSGLEGVLVGAFAAGEENEMRDYRAELERYGCTLGNLTSSEIEEADPWSSRASRRFAFGLQMAHFLTGATAADGPLCCPFATVTATVGQQLSQGCIKTIRRSVAPPAPPGRQGLTGSSCAGGDTPVWH